MNQQPKTLIQSGLEFIRMGHQIIAEAELDEADVAESIKGIQAGDMRLYRQLSQKPGFIDIVIALASRCK